MKKSLYLAENNNKEKAEGNASEGNEPVWQDLRHTNEFGRRKSKHFNSGKMDLHIEMKCSCPLHNMVDMHKIFFFDSAEE